MINKYELTLDSKLSECYQTFRKNTSKNYTDKSQNYPVVYLSATDFSTIEIKYQNESKLTLIVNLQDYYVFGFLFDDQCYSFLGVEKNLKAAGYTVDEVIPYGSAYYQIGANGIEQEVRATTVTKEVILSSINYIIDSANTLSLIHI